MVAGNFIPIGIVENSLTHTKFGIRVLVAISPLQKLEEKHMVSRSNTSEMQTKRALDEKFKLDEFFQDPKKFLTIHESSIFVKREHWVFASPGCRGFYFSPLL